MKKIFPILGLAILISAAVITLAITKESVKDPVCGMEVDPAAATLKIDSPHGTVYFCSQACMDKFTANPSAYLSAKGEKAPGMKGACKDCQKGAKTAADTTQAHKAGCPCCQGKAAGTAAAAATAPAAQTAAAAAPMTCTGECGQTKVAAINEFHKLMPDLESGDVAKIKASATELVARKDAVMQAKCPGGTCPEGFKAARTTFGEKVDALAAAAKTGDDASIKTAFNDMHKAYEALDELAR